MKRNNILLAALLASSLAANAQVKINVDAANPGIKVSPNLYGIFFEDINHAADGGLYAELISTPAGELLRKYGVAVSFGNETDHIMNRDETGWCPMETACRNVDSPTDMLRAIKEKMAEMMNGKQTDNNIN